MFYVSIPSIDGTICDVIILIGVAPSSGVVCCFGAIVPRKDVGTISNSASSRSFIGPAHVQ